MNHASWINIYIIKSFQVSIVINLKWSSWLSYSFCFLFSWTLFFSFYLKIGFKQFNRFLHKITNADSQLTKFKPYQFHSVSVWKQSLKNSFQLQNFSFFVQKRIIVIIYTPPHRWVVDFPILFERKRQKSDRNRAQQSQKSAIVRRKLW